MNPATATAALRGVAAAARASNGHASGNYTELLAAARDTLAAVEEVRDRARAWRIGVANLPPLRSGFARGALVPLVLLLLALAACEPPSPTGHERLERQVAEARENYTSLCTASGGEIDADGWCRGIRSSAESSALIKIEAAEGKAEFRTLRLGVPLVADFGATSVEITLMPSYPEGQSLGADGRLEIPPPSEPEPEPEDEEPEP